MKFKLLYTVGSFYPDNSGGPTITMYWMAKSLAARGVNVKVITTNRGIPKSTPLNKWLNTEYGSIKFIHTIKNTLPFSLFLKSLLLLRNAENLYLASFFYPLSFLVAPFAILMGVNVIWAPKGETSLDALKYGKIRKKVVLTLIRLLKSRIIFHATSEAEVIDIKRTLGRCEVAFIPVGMELPKPVKSSSEPRNLLFLGRIHPIKGLENLLKALALSDAFKSGNHNLLIAGYAQLGYDEVLKDLALSLDIAKKVKFIGKVSGHEKDLLLAESYALILPSFSENFGAVIAEALAQGTPCIASMGTPWETLLTYNAGYHVSNDPVVLSNTISDLILKPQDEYQHMRENARMLAEEVLDANAYSANWLEILKK